MTQKKIREIAEAWREDKRPYVSSLYVDFRESHLAIFWQ